MPTTIEQLGFTTVAIAIALIVVVVVQRKWPNDDTTDSLVLLYRRWAATGRLGFGAKEAQEKRAAEEREAEALRKSAAERARPPVPVPIPQPAPDPEPSTPAEAVEVPKPPARRPPGARKPAPGRKKAPVKKKAPARPAAKAKKPAPKRKPPARRPKAQPAPEELDVQPDVWLAAEAETEEPSDVDRPASVSSAPAHDPEPVREAETMTERDQSEATGRPADEAAPAEEKEREGRLSRWRRRRREEAESPASETTPADERPVLPAEPAAPAEPEPAVAPPEPVEPAPEPEPEPPVPVRAPPDAAHEGDHVPLATAQDVERHGEPKILLRQRFRRGLRRTRERLGAEMREAFTGGATPEAFDRLEDALVAADVGVATTAALVDDLRDRIGLSDKTLPNALRDVMVAQLQDADRRLRLVKGKVSVWVVVGVNGTGKTTTIAKLAARARDLGLPVSLAAADTFRAAAVEQLSEWGRRLGVDVVKQGQGADPGAVVFDAIANAKASGKRLLIVDTAGRLHTRKPLMDELQKVFRVIDRDDGAVVAETLLVIDATTGQNGISQAKAFKDAVSVTGLALAKLDGTAKGGITFAVERELGVPVKAVGVGESEKDLVPFDPQTFVEALVGED